MDRLAGHADASGLGPQAGAATVGTRHAAAKTVQPPPGRLARRGHVLLLQQGQHTEKPVPVAFEQLSAGCRRELFQGHVPTKLGLRHELAERGLMLSLGGCRASLPGRDRAGGQRKFRVGHDQIGVEPDANAEPLARRANPVGAVETERPRLQLLVADLAVGTGVQRAEEHFVPDFLTNGSTATTGRGFTEILLRFRLLLLVNGQHQPFAVSNGQLDRLGQPAADTRANHHAIDHGLDMVRLVAVRLGRVVYVDHVAVQPRADEPGLANRGKHVLMPALAAANHRGQDHRPRAVRKREQLVEDLFGGLLPDRLAALVAVRLAQPCKKQPQIVVDFGDRGHRAAGIPDGRPLVDRNRRLKALDQIDVGPLHLV